MLKILAESTENIMQTPDSSIPSSPVLSDDSIFTHSQEYQNTLARCRWRILAQALRKTEPLATMPTSVRRFQSFGLVSALPLENICEYGAKWFEYSATIGQEMFSVLVRHPQRNFTASDLMGFNNTGNICVWPSEEVLAYYGLCNRNIFDGKSVLEVGGGMSCLAGLMIGKYTSARRVHLTDGNVLAMDNVSLILDKNSFAENSHVTSAILQWGKHFKGYSKQEHPVLSDEISAKSMLPQYDVILCADCLFFDEVREDLVQTIFDFMADDGIALLTAPKRADTLEKFCVDAKTAGFHCSVKEVYNDQVWDRHVQLKENNYGNYDENIHYPLLLLLQKVM